MPVCLTIKHTQIDSNLSLTKMNRFPLMLKIGLTLFKMFACFGYTTDFLPPASAVEVIESVPIVCSSVSTLTAESFDVQTDHIYFRFDGQGHR